MECLTSTTPAVRHFWQQRRYYLASSREQLTRMKSDRYKKQKMPTIWHEYYAHVSGVKQ